MPQPTPTDGEADLVTLEELVNQESGNVTTRKGGVYPSINQRGADAQTNIETSVRSLYNPEAFADEAAVLADTDLPNGSHAYAQDTGVVYRKDAAGNWFETELTVNSRQIERNAVSASVEIFSVGGLAETVESPTGQVHRYTAQDGTISGYTAPDDGVFTAGEYETRGVPGPYSNRIRQHVFKLEATTGSIIDEVANIWRQLSSGPYDAKFLRQIAAGEIEVSRNNEKHRLHYRTANRIGGAGVVRGTIHIGQSLNLAHKDNGAVSILLNEDPVAPLNVNYGGAGMFDSSAFDGLDRGPRVLQVEPAGSNKNVALDTGQLANVVSLRESLHADSRTYYGTECSSLAHALLAQHYERETIHICAVIGSGSTEIAAFEKNSVVGAHYANALLVAQAMEDYATSIGRDCEIDVIWCQGEEDNSLGTPIATYKTALTGIATDLETDITAITGQTVFNFLVKQTTELEGGELAMAGIAHAELMIAGTVKGLATYPIKPGASGAVHMMPATYLPWGSAAAYELAACYDDPTRKPTHTTFDSKSGDTATFNIVGGSGAGYKFDTTTIDNAVDGNYGYTASDDSGSLDVLDMSIAGGVLTIQHDRTITGTLNWGFGIEHATGGASLMPRGPAPRVNIRDGSDWTCPQTGQVISGWMIQHKGSN